jgi:hypothetical protein
MLITCKWVSRTFWKTKQYNAVFVMTLVVIPSAMSLINTENNGLKIER